MDKYRNALMELELQTQKVEVITPVILSESTQKENKFITSQPAKLSPVSSIRSSEPDNGSGGFAGKNSVLSPEFPIEWLSLLEFFAARNRHVSYAVENIVTLASTEYEIYFSDGTPSTMQNKMKQYIKERADHYYEFSGGQTVLINDLFAQIAIYGCISIEKIPQENLKALKKVVRVSPKNVRSMYDSYEDEYKWVQIPRISTSRATVAGYIYLNPQTYTYMGIRHINESPYAVPPFLSAIEDLIIEYDMIGSFKTMMKKMGMLGMLSVLVNAPEQRETEDEEEYYIRVSNYLKTNVVPEVERQMSNGVAVGIKGSHEFKLEGTNMNTAGAESLMKIIKSMIFSGLKQDPNLHGENYSVTETFGKVILSKMSMQVRNYQQLVAKALEEIFMLDLVLAGFNPGYIEVKFKMPTISDQLKDEQTEQTRIANVLKKRDAGIIDQNQAATELGYEKPALKEAPVPTASTPAVPQEKSSDTSKSKEVKMLIKKMKGDSCNYDYTIVDCGSTVSGPLEKYSNDKEFTFVNDFGDSFLEKKIKNYTKEVDEEYEKSINRSVFAIKKDLENESPPQNEEQMTDLIFYNLYRNWDSNFSEKIRPITQKFVSETYEHYRKDKSIFKPKKTGSSSNSFFTAPDGALTLPDFRAIDYLERSDDFYLGKFIADKDTRSRITRWVSEYYIANGNPIGENPALITAFLKEFTELANLEAYKIRRITETTLNKSRSFASILYMEQANVATFEIVEINDTKTCDWCKEMDGKKFSVESASKIVKDTTSSPVEDVAIKSPFATSIKIDEFKGLSDTELLNMGIVLPPYHSHCRGRVVADI